MKLTVLTNGRADYAKHEAPIRAALAAVNGRANAFTVTLMVELVDLAERAEKVLENRGVTKANRRNARVTYVPPGPNAKKYKYSAKSTRVTLERTSSGWRLIDVREDSVYPKSSETFLISVTKAAADDIRRDAFAGLTIIQMEPQP